MNGYFAGMKVIETLWMVDQREDFSEVRSPSRALRRRKRGYPQRIKYVSVPRQQAVVIDDTIFVHPVIAQLLWSSALESRQ